MVATDEDFRKGQPTTVEDRVGTWVLNISAAFAASKGGLQLRMEAPMSIRVFSEGTCGSHHEEKRSIAHLVAALLNPPQLDVAF